MKKLSMLVLALLTVFCFTTTAKAAPSNLVQTEATDSSFKIAWTADINADGYYVQYSQDGVNFSREDPSQNSPDTYSADERKSNLSPGTVYYVKVASVKKDKWYNYNIIGDYSAPLQVVTTPAALSSDIITQISATEGSVTFAWTPVAGAEYYNIHNADDARTIIGSTPAPTFTIEGLAPNQEVNYYVSAAKKSAAGFVADTSVEYSWNGRVTCKTLPAAMSGLDYGISNYWSALGEVSFGSNRPNNADGTEIEVLTVKGSSHVWSSFDSSYFKYPKNKALKYRCRAYITIGNEKAYGAWGPYHYFACQKNASYSTGKRKIYLKWDKIAGVSGYKVLVSTNDKTGFKKFGTYSAKARGCTVTKYGKKGLKKGKSYYVRVIPIIKVGKKKYSSETYSQTYAASVR